MPEQLPAKSRGPYIVGPLYDWLWFLMPPAIALGLGILISGSAFSGESFMFNDDEVTWAGLLIGTIIHAHLVAVFFRSHGNPEIFALHRIRFVVVPIVLLVAIVFSDWVAVIAAVVATFWDVWHSGAQTFGFARIYDRNHNNPPEMGRRLDYWLNQLVYAGPILGGATLMDHVDSFENFESVGSYFFTSIPAYVEGRAGLLTWIVLVSGTLFIGYYLYAYWRFSQQGYRFSVQKSYLLLSTAACSIYSWGFNTWGEAFFIMNLFHAVQYLGLVWFTESGRFVRYLRLDGKRFGRVVCALLVILVLAAYGFFAKTVNPESSLFWSITIVVSLMHFWYDGFIWSVRKKQV